MRVKICGITNLEDALVALDAGADLLGFILYPKSPRYVTPADIARILTAIRTGGFADDSARFVGVFVNESLASVEAILAATDLDYAQLHGNETPALVEAMEGRGYKALRPATSEEAAMEAATYAGLGPEDGPSWLIDAYDPAAYGGTGQRADWPTAARLARRHPGLLLAGGLTPENVTAAINAVRPWGVDVASGVERAPGRKDHELVRKFVETAKAIVN
jgi:phosphoribosylanthranilate isomerase